MKRHRLSKHKKGPNALKHGVFANTAILPGEHQEQFIALHVNLRLEWRPVGPTQEDAVLTIAKCIWRKKRIQNFLEAKITSCKWDPEHAAYTGGSIQVLLKLLDDPPENLDLDAHMHFLPKWTRDHVRREFPKIKFKTTSERFEAIRAYLSRVAGGFAIPQPHSLLHVSSSKIITTADFEQEIALEEQLDILIDRAVKRLIQSKTMQQIMAQSPPAESRTQIPYVTPDDVVSFFGDADDAGAPR